jgi:hypothetical protein
MTILDQITREAKALPAEQRPEALRLIRAIRSRSQRASKTKNPVRQPARQTPTRSESYVPKDAALRAIAGIWKDRTDLPKDPVQAVKAIRARMWSRGHNG